MFVADITLDLLLHVCQRDSTRLNLFELCVQWGRISSFYFTRISFLGIRVRDVYFIKQRLTSLVTVLTSAVS